jgi:hypothetical protein
MWFAGQWCTPWAHHWSVTLTAGGHRRHLSTWSCCRRLPWRCPWAAGTHNFDVLLLPLSLFSSYTAATTPSCFCQWGPQRFFSWTGSCLLCLSRGCRSSWLCFVYSLAPAAAPWLSGEPFGFPFPVSKLCLHYWVVSRSWWITYAYHDGLRT